MQAILDFFASFADTITWIIQYVIGVIEDIVEMVVFLGMAAGQLPDVLVFLPTPIVVLLGSFLTAAILYKVLGREG